MTAPSNATEASPIEIGGCLKNRISCCNPKRWIAAPTV
jgi:hypothetical protein